MSAKFKEKLQQKTKLKKEPEGETQLPVLGGEFEVIEFIGRGGMGSVFKARKRESQDEHQENSTCRDFFAVKVLNKDLAADLEALKRFQLEIETVSHLNHPNLAAVFSSGRCEDGAPYLVMEYVEGITLQEWISNNGPLDETTAMQVFAEIAQGLEEAHRHGVLHRDLKPSNIILSGTADQMTAKIVDFGIAKLMPSESTQARETHDLTKTGDIFGTPTYMSPEQCLGFRLDHRSDIYSFGCLMYEALSGKPPFLADNPIHTVIKQINDEPQPWLNARCSKEERGLQAIVLKCLEKDPEDRYGSVDALLAELKMVSQGRQVSTRARAREPRAVLSKGDVLSLGVQVMILLFYFLMVYFGGFSIASPLPLSLFAFGFFDWYRKYCLKRENLLTVKTEREQWRTLRFVCLIAIACSSVPFFLASKGLLENLPESFFFFVLGCLLAQVFFTIGYALSLFFPLVFPSDRRVGFGRTAGKLIIGCISIFLLISSRLPASMMHSATLLSVLSSPLNQKEPQSPALAKAMLKTSIFLDPKNLDAYAALASLSRRTNDASSAVSYATRGLEISEGNDESAGDSGTQASEGEDDVDEASAGEGGIQASEGDDGIAASDEEIDADTAQLLVERAEAYINLSPPNIAGAMADVKRGLQAKDGFYESDLLRAQGDVYMSEHEFGKAVSSYSQALNYRFGRTKDVLQLRAIAFIKAGNYDAALADLAACAKQSDSYDNAEQWYAKRAIVFEMMGKSQEARNELLEAKKHLSDSELYTLDKSWSYQIQRIVGDSNRAAYEYLERSYLYGRLGEKEKAKQYLEVARSLGADPSKLYSDFCEPLGIKLSW